MVARLSETSQSFSVGIHGLLLGDLKGLRGTSRTGGFGLKPGAVGADETGEVPYSRLVAAGTAW